MAYERQRIPDDTALSTSVPDAPLPLARSVLERFRYGARKAAAQVYSPEGVTKETSAASSSFGPSFSQTTRHRTGLKIRALDINQSRTHVVLAGGKLLKTLRISQEPNCIEDFNLRTTAVNYAWNASNRNASSKGKTRGIAADSNSVQRDMFDIEDVAWSNNEFKDYIATAALNGKIMLYDMNRPGVEVGSLDEHYRQVHKVDFNPIEGACLLSGSQDGTVRLWDLRSYQNNAISHASMDTFPGRADGVRHVKWSPRDTWSFAFGTDNGVIQRWDTRNNRTPVLKFAAHHETCNSIDWHPDGRHLISAGKDKVIKVWDISPDTPRGKASFSVRTPSEVQNVRWRPSCFVMEPTEYQTIKQCTHFASSYRNYPVVQVWDLRRPHMPFREVNHKLNNGTTDMLWRSRDFLWTVGLEGEFTQTDVPFAPKTVDRRSLAAIACGPAGQTTFVSQKRLHGDWPTSGHKQTMHAEAKPSLRSSQDPESLPFGRSPGDDSFDERFLEVPPRRGHSRAASFKSSKSFSATPPSTDEMARMIATNLKTTMNSYQPFKPAQAGRTGPLPGTSKAELFTYLLQNYKLPISPKSSGVLYFENIGRLFEQNASFAQKASLYRDAQMWRILGFQTSKDLRQRAEANRRTRLEKIQNDEKLQSDFPPDVTIKTDTIGTVSTVHSPRNTQSRYLIRVDNHSNSATPIVRAMEKTLDAVNHSAEAPRDVQLPEALATDLESKTTDETSFNKYKADLMGGEIVIPNYNESSYSDNTSNRSPQMARAPYSLDVLPGPTQSISIPNQGPRRNSSESLWMFSTSSESPKRQNNEDSSTSTDPASIDRNNDFEMDGLRFNSSFRSNASAQSNLSSGFISQDSKSPSYYYNRESFSELPSHGNLRVDDFVETITRSPIVDRSDFRPRSNLKHESPEIQSPDKTPPPTTRPQYRLSDQDSLIPSTKNLASDSKGANEEADATILEKRPRKVENISIEEASYPFVANSQSLEDRKNNEVIFADYLTLKHDQETSDGIPSAIRSREMVVELLKWYSSQSDALTAAHIFFATIPLLMTPQSWLRNCSNLMTTSPDSHDMAVDVLPAGSDLAMSLAQSQREELELIGLSAEFVESILNTYHDELVSRELMNSATAFRRMAYPTFPAVFEQGLKDIEIHTLCLGCSHPINNPRNKMYCESCRNRQENCAVCWCNHSPFDWVPEIPLRTKFARNQTSSIKGRPDSLPAAFPGETSSLWATCPSCNHSIHVACADEWFADTDLQFKGSGGACPVPGCLCDCVRGFYRNERLVMLEAKERQKRQGLPSAGLGANVRRDDWSVNESRAVGRVRGALRDSKPLGGDFTEQLKTNPRSKVRSSVGHLTAQSRTMSDDGKRVRLVAPDDYDKR